jgi:hypothetical protein
MPTYYPPIARAKAPKRVTHFSQSEKVYHCECKTGAFCGEHMCLTIFQEYPIRCGQDFPTDDMRYLGSTLDANPVFTMINGPGVTFLLTKTGVQYLGCTSIAMDTKHLISSITISKSRNGIEIFGPTVAVMRALYDHAARTKKPICMEVTMSDGTDDHKNNDGSYMAHMAVLVIMPPKDSSLGNIYLLDPNTCSQIAQYSSGDIEAVLKTFLPADNRFTMVSQESWLKGRQFNINGSYASLGISSGWCRTISVLISGLIVRRENPMDPEHILEYLAKQSDELRILMYDATIRHAVMHILTTKECEQVLQRRDELMRKHNAEKNKK